jgi:hypothetical protein
MKLRTEMNLQDPDMVYAKLIAAFEELDEAAALRVAARLVFLLANHVGDDETVLEALDLARSKGV